MTMEPMDGGALGEDAGLSDGGADDAGFIDAGSIDAGFIDAGSIDAGSIDAGSFDAGSIDAGRIDAGPIDAGVTTDAGSIDAGVTADAGVTDAGGAVDAGLPGDAGLTDAGQACSAITFEPTAATFALPAGFPGSSFFSTFRQSDCFTANASPAVRTRDLTGDGQPDLVVTERCQDTTVGNSRWLLHTNVDGGFAPSATFALPAGYRFGSFRGFGGASTCLDANAFPAYELLELNGDQLPDLVVTVVCSDATVGNSRWLVHFGTPSGFAAVATSFTLPGGYPNYSFPAGQTEQSCATANAQPRASVLDLTGDGLADLVVTRKCTDATVGSTQWLVHRNTGTGFEQTPQSFAVPSGFPALSFARLRDVSDCFTANQYPGHFTRDVTGDGRPDLVVAERCSDATVGTSRWLVYENTGTGFATAATTWALPSGFPNGSFRGETGANSCLTANAFPQFSTLDLTGDGRPELVVTVRCSDSSVGTSKWLAFHNQGARFANTPFDVALPAGFTSSSFQSVSGASTCFDANRFPAFVTTDLTGDRLADLVMTQRCLDASVGSSHWLVFAGRCVP